MTKPNVLDTATISVLPGIPVSRLEKSDHGYFTWAGKKCLVRGEINPWGWGGRSSVELPKGYEDRRLEDGDILIAPHLEGYMLAPYISETGPMIAVGRICILRARELADYFTSYVNSTLRYGRGVIGRPMFRKLAGKDAALIEQFLNDRFVSDGLKSHYKPCPAFKPSCREQPLAKETPSAPAGPDANLSEQFHNVGDSIVPPDIDSHLNAQEREVVSETDSQSFTIQFPVLSVIPPYQLGNRYISEASLRTLSKLYKTTTEIGLIGINEHDSKPLLGFYKVQVDRIRETMESKQLKKVFEKGETSKIEFKSTLRYNLNSKQNDEAMENSVLKTIVAFCNTKGGTLYIGVGPTGEVVGLELDGFPDDDKFMLHLRNRLKERIVPSVLSYVEYEIKTVDGKSVCVVTCSPADKHIWLKAKAGQSHVFYVRTGTSSDALDGPSAVDYIIHRMGKLNLLNAG